MTTEALARRVGADDLFVLQQVGDGRVVNVDGHGRGAGWAGNIDLDPAAERWLMQVRATGFSRVRHGMPRRIFGPYWATAAAGVVEGDHFVVFGGGDVSSDDELLRDAARSAVAATGAIPVAKRLADDLEVTQAALSVAQLRPATLADAASAVATAASRATSCEFGAVLLYGPPLSLHLADEGWRPSATEDEIVAALLPLADAATEGLVVEQDTAASPFAYPPLSFQDGLVARCVVPLGHDGALGLLVVAHSIESPRGFTMLCQRVMGTVAQMALPVLAPLLGDPV